jgi:UDP-N-acetylmuramate--alanine ligase
MHDIKRAFLDFMDRVPFYGIVVACNDDPVLRRLFPKIRRRMVSYGARKDSDFAIKLKNESWPNRASVHVGAGAFTRPAALRAAIDGERSSPGRTRASGPTYFVVNYRANDLGEFRLHVPGMHNVLNATAAIAVGIGLDIPVPQIQEALENFRGVDRRFQVRGQAAGVTVIDDYGHHPTEIRATLAAANQCGYRKIHVIFQPHRYTRTRDLMDEFATAFSDADSLIVLDIYPASEQPIEGITGEALTRRIGEKGSRQADYAASFEDAIAVATSRAQEGDMILTLGAGSVSQLGPMVLEKLNIRSVASVDR